MPARHVRSFAEALRTGAWADDPSFLNSAGVSVQMKGGADDMPATSATARNTSIFSGTLHQQQPPTTTTTAAGAVEHGDGGSTRARKRR